MVMKIIKGLDFMFPIEGIKFALNYAYKSLYFYSKWVNRVDLR